jgi:transcriptional regulator with XRE-family HTH domain
MDNNGILGYNVSCIINSIGNCMANRVEIGKKVSVSRKALGYTQQKLSEITSINKTTISEIENGRFTGSFDIFERLLDAVDLQFDVSQKKYSLPDWDEIENIFSEDE